MVEKDGEGFLLVDVKTSDDYTCTYLSNLLSSFLYEYSFVPQLLTILGV